MDAKRNPLMMECVSTAALSLRLIRVIGFIMRLIAGDCVTLSIVPGSQSRQKPGAPADACWLKMKKCNTTEVGALSGLVGRLGLICVTAALLQGRRPLDLFSVDIYSPWEAALAFTLSSLTGYLLVNQWVLGVLPSNPFSLYVAELIMCFLAVTTCVPLLMGSSQVSPRWHTLASLVLVICFGALCLADEISRVVLFLTKEPPKEDTSMVIVPCAVVVLLYIGLVSVCTMKVIARLGVKRRAFEPYGTACVRKCKDYVAGRLAGTADAHSGPVPIPAAVLLQVVGVGAVMAMVLLQMGYMAWVQYNALRMLAVAMLRPIEPLFKLAGSPLPADVLDFAMPRTPTLALGQGLSMYPKMPGSLQKLAHAQVAQPNASLAPDCKRPMPGSFLSRLLPVATSLEELTPPRPPTKVRVISPELRDELQARALAMELAKKSGKSLDEAMQEDVDTLGNAMNAMAGQGKGVRRGPFGPHGPPGLAGPAGRSYGGYGGRGRGSGYDRYGGGGYGPDAAYGSPNGRRRRRPRGFPYQGDQDGLGSPGRRLVNSGNGPRMGGGVNGQYGGLPLPEGKVKDFKLAPPDVVPWDGEIEHGPCDPDDVFSVRDPLRKIAPLLIGSGCEKYVMDADKMLNDLPTDRDLTKMPACKNNFLVKKTAKTVYKVEKCAEKAVMRAEHVNLTQEEQIKELVAELQNRRKRVLIPRSSFSMPSKFAGHAKMTKKDWQDFDNSDAAGAISQNWGGGGGSPGSTQQWLGRNGRFGHGHYGHYGPHWHNGRYMHGFPGPGGYGGAGGFGHGDTYGARPHPKRPLQPGMGQGGMNGAAGGSGMGSEGDLTPKQQHEQAVMDRAKELAKANVDVPGPFRTGKHLEELQSEGGYGELPPPARPLKPIYPYPQPPILESETASVTTMPVYSGPDAPDVAISSIFPVAGHNSFAVGAAFLLLSARPEGNCRRKALATQFLTAAAVS
eukprot:s1025_g10.t1